MVSVHLQKCEKKDEIVCWCVISFQDSRMYWRAVSIKEV